MNRRFFSQLTVCVLVSAAAAAVSAASPAPPAGRYRCYQPPEFTVVSWFDFEADGTYRLQGGPVGKYVWEEKGRLVRWKDGDHARDGLVGLYLPPEGSDDGHRRHTIALARRADIKPGSAAWKRLPQCYLTEH